MASKPARWIAVALLLWLACSLALLPVAEARAKERRRRRAREPSVGYQRRSKSPPPAAGPCARVSNQTVRRRLGLVGDPSIEVDHIYDKARALKRGLFPDIEANLEPAPQKLNNAWGQLLRQGRLAELERSKRKFHGHERYEEAILAVQYCNQRYRYT